MAKVVDQFENLAFFVLFVLVIVLLWAFVIVPLWNSGDLLTGKEESPSPSAGPFPQTRAYATEHPIGSLLDPEAIGFRGFLEWLKSLGPNGGSSQQNGSSDTGDGTDFNAYAPAAIPPVSQWLQGSSFAQ